MDIGREAAYAMQPRPGLTIEVSEKRAPSIFPPTMIPFE
jgi:hypothetical protein